jgi:uncharacterized membrane protein YeiB
VPTSVAQTRERLTVGAHGTGRVLALDVARAVALLGMVVVNVGPRDGDGPVAWVFRLAHGRASLLFVLLAGVGVGMLLASDRPRSTASLLVRGVLLLVGGLALQLLDHDVSVILPTYAALFGVAALVTRLPSGIVLGAALGATVLGPVVWTLAQTTGEFELVGPTLTDGPVQVLVAVVLTGPYPLVTWMAPFLLGIWLGRQDLGDPRLQRRLLVGGAAIATAAIAISAAVRVADVADRTSAVRLLSTVAHSQTPLWLLAGTGSAVAMLAVVLLVVPRLGRLARPAAALGRLSLTAYVAHLLVIALLVRPGPPTAEQGLAIAVAFTLLALAGAWWWRRRLGSGPLERLLRAPERLLVRRPAPDPSS